MKKIWSRSYKMKDFDLVRQFLVDCYSIYKEPVTWKIDRWNFTYAFSSAMRDTTIKEWESEIRLWFRGDELIAIVNTEGEKSAEAFIQSKTLDLDDVVLNEVFDFVETDLVREIGEKQIAELRISERFNKAIKMAESRGYELLEWSDCDSLLELDREFEVKLPEGFNIVEGDAVSHMDKGMLHAKAFNYTDEDYYVRRTPIGYGIMCQLKDYRADLDLYIKAPNGELTSFVTIWVDHENGFGVLEPVGTSVDYQGLGLGKALIYEGANRLRAMGINKLYVGSEKPFYLKIGFKKVLSMLVYRYAKL